MPRPSKKRPPRAALQLLIVLGGSDPLIWRRILVPEEYSFWDLHVAIQDAMGWTDSHLHDFTVIVPGSSEAVHIGIPDDGFPDDRSCLPGWEVEITEFFSYACEVATYLYDFGDSWIHSVQFEDHVYPEAVQKLPACIGGQNACPPEDCGGMDGYREFVSAIGNPRHPEHEAMRTWVNRLFDPSEFDPAAVRFDDPKERFRLAFR